MKKIGQQIGLKKLDPILSTVGRLRLQPVSWVVKQIGEAKIEIKKV